MVYLNKTPRLYLNTFRQAKRTWIIDMFLKWIINPLYNLGSTTKLIRCDLLCGPDSRPICSHYDDVTMSAIASQITSLAIIYSIVYSDADQSKHQSSASLAFVWGIHRGPVNSPHKWPVTRKMFPFDDVIMPLSLYWFVAAYHPPTDCVSWSKKFRLQRLLDQSSDGFYSLMTCHCTMSQCRLDD